MNGMTLPKCYQDHEPPAGYFDPVNPEHPVKMSFGYCVRDVADYINKKGIDPNDLSWEELQMFRFEFPE